MTVKLQRLKVIIIKKKIRSCESDWKLFKNVFCVASTYTKFFSKLTFLREFDDKDHKMAVSKCGHLLGESCWRKIDSRKCPICTAKFTEADIICVYLP